jgi:hypothetical protein
MKATYKTQLKRLRTTGEGVKKQTNASDSSADQVLDFYIGPQGPDETTPQTGKNIWGAYC